MTTFTMYDSTRPKLIPPNVAAAVYKNGRYAAPPDASGRFEHTLWIDVLATAPECEILDVETGDASPADVPGWCQRRWAQFGEDRICRPYVNLGNWPAVKYAVGTEHFSAEQLALIRYWVANPTREPHLVPGSEATQYSWGPEYDLSLCLRQFGWW